MFLWIKAARVGGVALIYKWICRGKYIGLEGIRILAFGEGLEDAEGGYD